VGGLPGSGLSGSGLPGSASSASGLPGAAAGSGVGGGPAGAGLGPAQLISGSPGSGAGAGTPGGSQGSGGVPFFPPMMGGAGAGGTGEKPQERERQTWLAEDEDVWGTDVEAGSGVIGRVEDVEDVDEPLVAALPGQERIHPAGPRRGSTDEPEQTAAYPAAT